MTKEEIFDRVRRIISEETGVPLAQILWDSDLVDLEERSTVPSCCNRGDRTS